MGIFFILKNSKIGAKCPTMFVILNPDILWYTPTLFGDGVSTDIANLISCTFLIISWITLLFQFFGADTTYINATSTLATFISFSITGWVKISVIISIEKPSFVRTLERTITPKGPSVSGATNLRMGNPVVRITVPYDSSKLLIKKFKFSFNGLSP